MKSSFQKLSTKFWEGFIFKRSAPILFFADTFKFQNFEAIKNKKLDRIQKCFDIKNKELQIFLKEFLY